jgi:hypothetical protein
VDHARLHLIDHEIQANNFTWFSHPAYSPELATANFWFCGSLQVMLKRSSFEMAEEL